MSAPGPAPAFVRKLLLALRPFPAQERYLVGVSGGRDSVALLHGLVAAGYQRLVICHLDHGLRGEASAGDADFVQGLGEKWKLPVVVGRTDARTLAHDAGLSLETAAREARRTFFAQVAGRRRCGTIFLAHHADDQVETFLFNLLRGAGPVGLCAMAADEIHAVGRRRLRILRPLLGVWRTEIDAYVQSQGIVWREDATNADPSHATRNRLRAEAIPVLERAMGRAVRPALWRAADLLQAEEAWIAGLCKDGASSPARLPVASLLPQPVAAQRRALRAWLSARGVGGVGYAEVERVRELLDLASGPSKVNLPGDCHARRRAGVLFIEKPRN